MDHAEVKNVIEGYFYANPDEAMKVVEEYFNTKKRKKSKFIDGLVASNRLKDTLGFA